jgi:hypothetical protein
VSLFLGSRREGNNSNIGSQNMLRKKRVQYRLTKWRGKPWRVLSCLKCEHPFRSVGPGNRLCDFCREQNTKIDWSYVRWVA